MSRIIGSEPTPKTPYTPPPIEPINDRVVVQADVIPELTKGGLALPNDAVGRRLSRYGTVIAVGPGAMRIFPLTDPDRPRPGHPDLPALDTRFPMQTKVGDRVILPAAAERMTMDPDDRESELVILQESQLLAILR